jgi:hypothetical protein
LINLGSSIHPGDLVVGVEQAERKESKIRKYKLKILGIVAICELSADNIVFREWGLKSIVMH